MLIGVTPMPWNAIIISMNNWIFHFRSSFSKSWEEDDLNALPFSQEEPNEEEKNLTKVSITSWKMIYLYLSFELHCHFPEWNLFWDPIERWGIVFGRQTNLFFLHHHSNNWSQSWIVSPAIFIETLLKKKNSSLKFSNFPPIFPARIALLKK